MRQKTDETVRWDEPNESQKGHWHRFNPDKETNKKQPYLDPKGKPTKKNSPDGHITPNPKGMVLPPMITTIKEEFHYEENA